MDKSADPIPPMTQLALPDWLTQSTEPAPTLTSVELARLKRENLLTSYESALDGILIHMVEHHTSFYEAVRDDPRGFGLWVCREIATQYGGGFDVDHQHGQGTRLVFWIPNRESHEDAPAD